MVCRKAERKRFPASGAAFGYLFGTVCTCRKRFSAGGPGAKTPAN